MTICQSLALSRSEVDGMRNGYKMTEIGMIPDDWEVKKLKDISYFRNGKAHEKSIDSAGKYIVVNSKFISTNGKVRKYTAEQIEPLFTNEIAMVMSDVPNGKAIAKCFLIDRDDTYTLNQRICGLKIMSEYNPQYIHKVLNRNPFLLKFDDGVKQTNLRKDEVLSCPIPIPPLLEQQRIANFLSTVDDYLYEAESFVEKIMILKQGLMANVLTGKTRL